LIKVRFRTGEVGETLYVTDVALIAESRADVGLPEKPAVPAEILDGKTMSVVAGEEALYAGTDRGLFRSDDGGQTWKRLGKGILHAMAFSLAIEPGNPEVVYAGTWDGPFKSDNRGETWAKLGTGCAQPDVRSIVVHPSDPEIVYLALYGEGILKSTDAGFTWNNSNTGLSTTVVRFLVPHPSDPNRLYAGTGQQWGKDNALFRSQDGGASWSQVSLEAALPTCMASAVPSVLYVGTWRQGVFVSQDDGHSWRPANEGLLARDIWSIAVDPADSSRVYAGTGTGVFKTDDAGQSWSELDTALRGRQVYAIALDLLGQTRLHVGTDRGVQTMPR
jgi:photosystem II stability/assembly factor-like uncharacterized protein